MKKGERKISEEQIFEILREYPLINANHLASILNIHYFTAKKYLVDLENKQILKREERRRGKYTLLWWKVIGDVRQTKLAGHNNPQNIRVLYNFLIKETISFKPSNFYWFILVYNICLPVAFDLPGFYYNRISGSNP